MGGIDPWLAETGVISATDRRAPPIKLNYETPPGNCRKQAMPTATTCPPPGFAGGRNIIAGAKLPAIYQTRGPLPQAGDAATGRERVTAVEIAGRHGTNRGQHGRGQCRVVRIELDQPTAEPDIDGRGRRGKRLVVRIDLDRRAAKFKIRESVPGVEIVSGHG